MNPIFSSADSSASSPESNCCPQCGAVLPADAIGGLCPRCLMIGAMQPTQAGVEVAAVATMTPEELGPHFPQLEILECLGRGGMGVVYKARQKSLNRMVALKLLAPERAGDPEFAARFEKEAHALAALNHAHIVGVYDFGQAGGYYFLLMEFIDGVNLRQLLQTKRLTPKEALSIVPPICEALQCAHDHGIVHRDIKPENLLIDKAGVVKIADFGIAKMIAASGGVEGAAGAGAGEELGAGVAASLPFGTPCYAAPEQLETGAAADHRADIYSLGVVLYEMLTGERPKEKLEAPSKRVQVDVRIDEIVLRALEARPELRYQTVTEMRTQVEAVNGGDAAAAAAEVETRRMNAGVEGGGDDASGKGRFSRTALIGAGWVSFFFAVVPAFLWHEVQTHEFERAGPFASGLMVFIFFGFIFPAFIAPFGATILGWVAVTRIRHSAGKLYGLGLAVFDALFFPLLALDALIVAVDLSGRQHVSGPGLQPGVMVAELRVTGWQMVLMLAFIVLVDWLIIRAVWRALTKSGEGRGAGTATQAEVENRFSRTALVGALWIPFCIAAAAFILFEPHHDFPYAWNFPATFLCFLSLAGVIGSTILGWVAVTQIRRSAGRTYGLWLAVFDALFFPLLALDRLLLTTAKVEEPHLSGPARTPWTGFGDDHPSLLLLLVCGFIVLVDWLIVRAVWRAVTRKPGGGDAGTACTTQVAAAEAWLGIMDRGEYAQSWAAGSAWFQREVTQEAWVKTAQEVRWPLGACVSRRRRRERMTACRTRFEVWYDSVFDALPQAREHVLLMREGNGEWKITGYVVRPGRGASMRAWPVAALALCVPLGLWCLLASLRTNEDERDGQWHAQRVSAQSAAVPNPLAAVRFNSITRVGTVVVFDGVSEASFPGHEITASFLGRPKGEVAATSVPPEEVLNNLGLLVVSDDAGHPTQVLRGAATQRGPGAFRFGFVLPDEERAEMVLKQARELHEGRTVVVGSKESVKLLFLLRRFPGRRVNGVEEWELLQGALNFEAER